MIHVIIFVIAFVLLTPLSVFAEETGQTTGVINEWYFQIALVAIPVIGAFLTTKFVAENWQDRKEKYELQEKILDKVDEAYTDYYLDVWNFVYEIGIKYFDESTYQYDRENDKIKFDKIENFPTEASKLPPCVFAEGYKKIYSDGLSISVKNIEKLWTIILCYYGDKTNELDAMTKEIYKKADLYLQQFYNYFHSTKSQEFEDYFDKLYVTSTEVLTLTRELKSLLLQTKMKKRKF